MYIPWSGKFFEGFAKTNTLNLCLHMPAKIEPAKMLQNTLNLLKFSLYSKFFFSIVESDWWSYWIDWDSQWPFRPDQGAHPGLHAIHVGHSEEVQVRDTTSLWCHSNTVVASHSQATILHHSIYITSQCFLNPHMDHIQLHITWILKLKKIILVSAYKIDKLGERERTSFF